jgi:hypothetical protein
VGNLGSGTRSGSCSDKLFIPLLLLGVRLRWRFGVAQAP